MADAPLQAFEEDTIPRAMTRVLVVEDNADLLKILARCLTTEGYSVDTAARGDEALERLLSEDYALVLSDINLPGLAGTELLRECRKACPCTEVILITGDPHLTTAVACMKQGAYDYISKPLKLDAVRHKVADAIEANIKRRRLDHTVVLPEVPGGIQIIRSLGAGSSGMVLLVEKDGAPFAMKIVRTDLAPPLRDPVTKRFYREAAILSKIKHPNIVAVHEWGSTPVGQPYILMEYVPGTTLKRFATEQVLSTMQKLELVLQLGHALAAVHRKNVVHRDIKPGNILVTEDAVAKLTDFGLARFTHVDSSLTLPGSVVGSPAYMAPENFNGGTISHRSDIFSLGVLMYELLTGENPHHGDTLERVIHVITQGEPRPPDQLEPRLPLGISPLIMTMLKKDPAERCASIKEVVRVVESIIARARRR